jgi:transposase
MVNEETLKQVPEDVRQYLRVLRRRIVELEQTDSQRRVAELEATNRKLQTQVDDALALVKQQQEQIRQLQQQLTDMRGKLQTNSTNSSLPPSSDRFRSKRRPPPVPGQPRSKRGGQPGHRRHQRLLVPDDQIQQTIPCVPSTCRRCGRPLSGTDPAPLRHQVAELPVVRPDIVEYQLHRLTCPCCPAKTCGRLPPEVKGQFGSRLEATLAVLAGRHRLGLRPVVALALDLWGLDISPGMVSKLRRHTAEALLVSWVEVALHVRTQNVNIDETPWREGQRRAYLWGVVAPFASLFRIEGVEPTNNAGERAERQGVLWRKTSGGTHGPHGSRFVERVLTVVHTCRQQGKDVLDYLGACIQAWRHGRAPPPLLAGGL